MPRKRSLVVSVDVTIHAVTCPGAVLLGGERVYMSVCVLGCYAKTRAAEPSFPLLFRQTLHVRKVLEGVHDLDDLTDVLEAEDITFELIQLCPPAGETLATHAESASSLLDPGPLREVLMARAPDFPGLSPRLDFSARVLVVESRADGSGAGSAADRSATQPSSPPAASSPAPGERRPRSPGYREATAAWRARCPSPYTERRMCERSSGPGGRTGGGRGGLAAAAGGGGSERLPHLGLGPWHFASPLRDPPAFVVRRVNSDSSAKASPLKSPSTENRLRSSHSPRSQILDDTSLRGSYRPSQEASQSEGRRRRSRGRELPAAARVSWAATPAGSRGHGGRTASGHRDGHASDASLLRDPARSVDSWERVHERVKGLLTTHGARRTLHHGSGGEEEGEARRRVGSAERALHRLSLTRSSDAAADSSEATGAAPGGAEEWLEWWRCRAASLRAAEPHRAALHREMGRAYRGDGTGGETGRRGDPNRRDVYCSRIVASPTAA